MLRVEIDVGETAMTRSAIRWLLLAVLLQTNLTVSAEVTLENVVDPGPNERDEQLASEYSLDQATKFLDSASLQWQKQRKCFTCHTNFPYLYARPAISPDDKAHQEVRAFAEQLVNDRWQSKGPRWDAEVVAAAAALSYNDALSTGELQPATKTALDRMWTLQREDGGWDWLKCGWPPMESDDHFGVTLAAIAAGAAPNDYAQSPAVVEGMNRIRTYFKSQPPPTLHHRGMLLWANSYHQDLITDDEKKETVDAIFALQKEDGGWAIATFGDWERADDQPQDTTNSDGYGTGFAVFVLRKAGISADDERLQRAVGWLHANQRASGRWFTRSLNKDNHHFLSHAGSSMAVMALAECNALKRNR